MMFLSKFFIVISHGEKVFKRGNENIWAAAIVWAVGSINFLGDKTFKPFATLSDVCAYFLVNTSTVGQKAGRIRVWLEMDFLNEKYLFSDSPVRSFIDSLVVTEDGFILPVDWLEEDEDEEENHDEDEKLEDCKIVEKGRIIMNFYGRPHKVLEFEKKLGRYKFDIYDIVDNS